MVDIDIPKPKSILFVCIGNVIRSPFCEGLFIKIMKDIGYDQNITCSSAAIGAKDIGRKPRRGAIKLAKTEGFDISNHKSRKITKKDFLTFNLIVSLEPPVYNALLQVKPIESKAEIVEFIPKIAVINPYSGLMKDYKMMHEQITKGMPIFIRKHFGINCVRNEPIMNITNDPYQSYINDSINIEKQKETNDG
ncbi:Low molecular weight phosphotyrosine protein phosphatase [Tritrichomonas foetus]|uniref:Low molecular weight phosphotyrosine protein phosphatase n=1 Tax=Tritrichomonas foetus TaxID=1144522 RepID=A0A1J4JL75_9EUKA|nr:Low molecular weight phosphotyrosine protein phosphatase [Tritrichomonas foetus]|eukprot:OHS99425.1 Low molecular weight phosphotyrosine protein phosphatase [Tritrichomonas foetus]